jgi:diguanylate cyclase (GGDEF)-like protein
MTETLDRTSAPSTHAKLLAIIMDSVSVGICCFGPDQTLVVSNRRYAELYGLTQDQIRPGMPLHDIIRLREAIGSMPDDAPDTLNALVDRAVKQETSRGTVSHLHNGRIVSISQWALPDGGWFATHEDVTDCHTAEQRLSHMAHHDPLTGLANRTMLREALDAALAARDAASTCAVICIDLDRFKEVNDTLGLAVGDEMLRAVARRLRAAVPPDDLLARTGNNEFVVIQRGGRQPEDALALWRAVSASLARPFRALDQTLSICASGGIAVAPRDGSETDQVLRNAALALSRARSEGGGRAEPFVPDMNAAAQRRRMLDSELRTAIARGELELAFQPVARMKLRRVGGFEALLRWTNPEIGRVSPAEFIPLAEQNGMIVPIGAWVLRTACMAAAQWPDGLTVAVNVSASQLHAPGLVATVSEVLAASGLPSRRLELEITESTMMQNWQDTAATLQQIKRLGVRIAMDDFGTGFSSLSYLRRFPFDKIKVDQSFVRELTSSSQSVAIVRAILALCDALGMSTTAEGVETQEQFAILAAEGCTDVQGYLLSQPRPASEISGILDRVNAVLPALRPVPGPTITAALAASSLRRPAYAQAPGGEA